jgi:hypothetical protein
MNMIKGIFVCVVIGFLLSACSGSNDAGTAKLGVKIHYVDSSGNDLYSLVTDGYNGFWKDSILLYDITSAKIKLPPCYETGLAYQLQASTVTEMIICANANFLNGYSYTLIHLKTGTDDTLKVHIDKNAYSPAANIDMVWYNGVLKAFDSAGSIMVVK